VLCTQPCNQPRHAQINQFGERHFNEAATSDWPEERRVGARLSTGLRVLGRRGYGPTRERLSAYLCIADRIENARI
jgi:hypothetical protein